MLSQTEALEIIIAERLYQDKTYNPDKVLSSGLTRQQRDLDVTSHLTMLDTYLRKAQDAWTTTTNGESLPSLQQIAKIAAIALRALERAGGSEQLLVSGLR